MTPFVLEGNNLIDAIAIPRARAPYPHSLPVEQRGLHAMSDYRQPGEATSHDEHCEH
ncbi:MULTISPECIES: hypothetical protein [unclassified Nocardioides]|uniref:hypothetical protein n=1 Tax=unclassified Nocardioides TaxID=2615069 RepID=UPI0013051136|nr:MULTISPECIES: hypothetical protein [unclassified Nocardioides]